MVPAVVGALYRGKMATPPPWLRDAQSHACFLGFGRSRHVSSRDDGKGQGLKDPPAGATAVSQRERKRKTRVAGLSPAHHNAAPTDGPATIHQEKAAEGMRCPSAARPDYHSRVRGCKPDGGAAVARPLPARPARYSSASYHVLGMNGQICASHINAVTMSTSHIPPNKENQ